MMKKNYYTYAVLILLVLVLLVLSGCGGQGYDDSYKEINYFQGNDGLVIEFLKNNPPDELYEDSDFNVNLQIWNKGASDLLENMGYYGTINYVYDSFYLDDETMDPESIVYLKGKSFEYPKGEFEYYSYNFRTRVLTGQSESPKTTLIMSVCYPYFTMFSDDVCIDFDISEQDMREKVCSAEDITYAAGQGAPISVVQVRPRMRVTRSDNPGSIYPEVSLSPEFLVDIENVGGGDVMRWNSLALEPQFNEVCAKKDTSSDDWNSVYVINARIGDKEMVCLPEIEGVMKPIKLRLNKATLHCKLGPDEEPIIYSKGNYLSTFTLELSYVYINTVTKDVEIIRVASD